MNKEETLTRWAQGKDAWNAWARRMLNLLADMAAKQNQPSLWASLGMSGADEDTRERLADAEADFAGHLFDTTVDFRDWLFPGSANFKKTTFDRGASFIGAAFSGFVPGVIRADG